MHSVSGKRGKKTNGADFSNSISERNARKCQTHSKSYIFIWNIFPHLESFGDGGIPRCIWCFYLLLIAMKFDPLQPMNVSKLGQVMEQGQGHCRRRWQPVVVATGISGVRIDTGMALPNTHFHCLLYLLLAQFLSVRVSIINQYVHAYESAPVATAERKSNCGCFYD